MSPEHPGELDDPEPADRDPAGDRDQGDDEPSGTERLVLCHRVTPSGPSVADALAWQRAVMTRIDVAGGELLGCVGSSVLCSFDALELDDVIELALGLLDDLGPREAQLEIACGLALGDVTLSANGGTPAGSAIDRAWVLSARAHGGELALDGPAREHAAGSLLFTHTLQVGGALGHVLDARFPFKRDCREALPSLHAPELPERAQALFEQLRAHARKPGRAQLVVRAPQPHTALDWLQRLIAAEQPALALQVAPRAGGLQPLGALQRAFEAPDVQARARKLDAASRDAFAAFARGAAVHRSAAVHALHALLRSAVEGGGRAWIVVRQAQEIDLPSFAVIGEAIERGGVDPLVWLLSDDATSPGPLVMRGVTPAQLSIEPLLAQDRVRVAQAVLGPHTDPEVARRVAAVGGETALAIVEAARTLVASGDLVLRDQVFGWRAQPRAASLPIPIEALLTERLAGLETSAHRLLEAICTVPPGAPFALASAVASQDGLSSEAIMRAEQQLRREGWLNGSGELGSLEYAIVSAVRNAMPPSRAAELNRFVADALEGSLATLSAPAYGRALLAHHWAEGGRELDASRALLDAAQAASENGFERMGLRLAALARRLDASVETVSRARGLAHRLETSPPIGDTLGGSSPPPLPAGATHQAVPAPSGLLANDNPRDMAAGAMRSAVAAIVVGDLDAAEHALDVALAAGWDAAAAQRLWSIAQLRRGNVPEAVRALKQVHGNAGEPGCGTREAIAAGLILLEAGAYVDAVRSGLEALANARRKHDSRAEHVALELLAGCYRALGRDSEADGIAAAAAAVA